MIAVLAQCCTGCPGRPDVPAPPKGGLAIAVDPPEARVYVDGQLVGTAATWEKGHVPLYPGHHRVKLVADGWFDEYMEVDIGEGVTEVSVEMTAVPEPIGADPP